MVDFEKENEKFLQKNKELFEPYIDGLISKEKVLLMLSELLEVANEEGFSAEDTIDHIYEWVKNIPTDYDINKVVGELEL